MRRIIHINAQGTVQIAHTYKTPDKTGNPYMTSEQSVHDIGAQIWTGMCDVGYNALTEDV